MSMRSWYDIYIYSIIFVKVIFLVLCIYHFYLNIKMRKQPNNAYYKKLKATNDMAREFLEFIFVFMMSTLLIYLFYPSKPDKPVCITSHTKFLFFLFGIILILTAKWEVFFENKKELKELTLS